MALKENDIISVIVVTYNAEKFILETLESIKRQSYPTLELIIADDCSTDNTIRMTEQWISLNKQRFINTCVVVPPKNTGISANMNRGLKAATGKYIKAIAGDDILMDNCLVDNYAFAEKNKAGFVYSNLIYFGSHTDTQRIRYEKITLNEFIKQPARQQMKFLARYPTFTNSPTWFFSRTTLEKMNFYDEEFVILDDQHIAFKAILNGEYMHYLNLDTVKYRVHANSVSRSLSRKKRIIVERKLIYKKYRAKYLSFFNIKDVLSMIDFYLTNSFTNLVVNKGLKFLNPLYYKRIILSRWNYTN
ncbi:MAG: glycosyltransferase [Chitinophagaceae bacterium]